MDATDGGYGTSQMPLAGTILCCTSIPPEQRAELATVGTQMGAAIKLDLTSDVTHLIVGDVNSAKYRYVAKAREDVKVLAPEWLEALRAVWMEGDDVDVAALENEHRLPTFYGLKICLTGFDNPEQRKYIQEMVTQNGAEYHGDLTKSVTHLIAAMPSGKKYEHAVNWRMKIVSWEWFEQSVQRGMALDEKFYHPTIPLEERGKGAWDRRKSMSPTLGKRTRGTEQTQATNPLRRKLRRSASSKMGSQSEALWAGITAASLERKKDDDDDDWTEDNLAKQTTMRRDGPPARPSNVAVHQNDAQSQEDPASEPLKPSSLSANSDGIFKGRIVFPCCFDAEKTNILHQHLDSNGATVIRASAELDNFSSDDLRRGYLVIPSDGPVDDTMLPQRAGGMCLVTNWWVERCLYGKSLVDPTEHILCRPFDKFNISRFDGLIVNSTAFTGMELLHVTKVVALMGAKYDEILSSKTSVMICNTRKPNPEKLRFTTDKRIPAVHATWLWDCIRTGERQAFDHYLLNNITLQPQNHEQKPQSSFTEIPTAPLSEEDSLKLQQKKAQASRHVSKAPGGSKRPGTLDLALSADATPVSTTISTTDSNIDNYDPKRDQDRSGIEGVDGPASLPLQDLNPSVNSRRQPSISLTGSTTHPKTKAGSNDSDSSAEYLIKPFPAQRGVKSRLAKKPTPDSVIPAPDSVIPADTEPLSSREEQKEEKDYSDLMSKLRANRRIATTPADQADEKRRKRRQLGRATSTRSNQSTGEDPFSRTTSLSGVNPNPEEDENDGEIERTKKTYEEYQPSQELGWDSPGAQQARERMIRALGGKVEERNVVQGIGVVKDAVSDVRGLRARSRKSRG